MLVQNDMIPLYQQLKTKIKDSILSGELKQGDKIQTEEELSKVYNVSRITVRSAISELADEGMLVKKQGKGTFVSRTKIEREIIKLLSFSSACRVKGLTPSSKITKKAVVNPTKDQIDNLNLDKNDKLIRIQRIRLANEEPIMVENTYFSYNNYSFLLGEEHLNNSLYEILSMKYNIIPCKSINSIEIVRATEDEAEYLNISKGFSLLLIKGVVYDEKNIPVHISEQYIDGDKYKLSYTNTI